MEHVRTADSYYKIPIDTVTLGILLLKPVTLRSVCLTDFNILTRNESTVDKH
jgi:hypothetical protein